MTGQDAGDSRARRDESASFGGDRVHYEAARVQAGVAWSRTSLALPSALAAIPSPDALERVPLRSGGVGFRSRDLGEATGLAVKRSATVGTRAGAAVNRAPPPEVVSALSKADRLYSSAEVEAAFDSMAGALSLVVAERAPLVLAVMTGGLIPAAKLLARWTFPLELDYVHVTRYRGGLEGRDVEWRGYPSASISGRVVLVVDDILDEGFTLAAVMEHCRGEGASAVFTAVLVDKQHERTRRVPKADFTGLRVPDRYVFGSGMDYRGYYRNLPGIYAVEGT